MVTRSKRVGREIPLGFETSALRFWKVKPQGAVTVLKTEGARKGLAFESSAFRFMQIKLMNLFESKDFTMHSGGRSDFKIECDALTDEDIATLAKIISSRVSFRSVVGVPSGGIRLANALKPYCIFDIDAPVLIVDDVLTTGASMEEEKTKYEETYGASKKRVFLGVVIFARGKCPDWIKPIFQFCDW